MLLLEQPAPRALRLRARRTPSGSCGFIRAASRAACATGTRAPCAPLFQRLLPRFHSWSPCLRDIVRLPLHSLRHARPLRLRVAADQRESDCAPLCCASMEWYSCVYEVYSGPSAAPQAGQRHYSTPESDALSRAHASHPTVLSLNSCRLPLTVMRSMPVEVLTLDSHTRTLTHPRPRCGIELVVNSPRASPPQRALST